MEQQAKIRVSVWLAIAMSICFGPGQHGIRAGEPKPNYDVHTFYYPWYGNPQTDNYYEHWNHLQSVKKGKPKQYPGGDDIGADFYPKLGCYSSNSEDDLNAHMQMLRRAQVGVISTSWWGKDSYTDKAVPRLLNAAAKHDIKVCFHIEPFPGRNAQTTRDAIVYIIDKYGSHPAIYRYGKDKPRPMFYVYDSYLTPAKQWKAILSPDGGATIRNTKYDSVVIGLWVKEHEQAFMTEGSFDGYYTYFATDGFTYGSTIENWPKLAEWARQNNKLFIPSVGPGYVDLRIRPWNNVNTRSRRNGAYYDREFAAAIAVNPQIVSITSFNEWHEGSQIEPAVPKEIADFKYRDYEPHYPEYYLDRTSYWVSRFVKSLTGEPTKYMIIVTGGELLSGVYPDGHTYFLTRTLRPLGLECVGSMSVDDKKADLKEALHYATDKAALVIVTGGLGPTENDITREALSEFTAIKLKEEPTVLEKMAQRFRVSPAQLRANLRRQTQVPTQGRYLKNSNGTALGLVFESAKSVIVALPGPPRELQAMFSDELVPYLKERFGTRLPGSSITLRFVGLGQSQISQTLRDHVPLASDIIVSSQFQGSRVDFTFSLPNDTPHDRERLQELKRKILGHLGDNAYADDETSLEECVVRMLESQGVTLSLAEVGSGGSLAAAISEADSEHRVLVGAYIAPTMEKLRRLLSVQNDKRTEGASPSQQTEQLAKATADVTDSKLAIAVGQAWRDENGAAYVSVAFKLPDGRMESRKVRLRGSGELARSRLETQLLDQLRRLLR
ncbi:MAG: molybdopterin-binding protein [Sedimentisphaerales bacterium]|nr:molybdopterin-binding protein [Sedimentisphaerales bacterium]